MPYILYGSRAGKRNCGLVMNFKWVVLNIQHGGGKCLSALINYLCLLKAEMIVLTEFRENKNAPILRRAFASEGLSHFAAASISPRENSVCIFSRKAFVSRTYPVLFPNHIARVVSAHFDSLSIYGVYFPGLQAKADVFRFFLDGSHQPTEDEQIIIGDFNTGLHKIDELGSTFHCTEEFAALSSGDFRDSWRTRNPKAKDFSWYSNKGNGFRIDHVLSNLAADSKIQRIYYDHTPRESGISDHSAMVVEYGS